MIRIKLTKSQWQRVSEIFSNLGIVSMVGFVIPYFSGESDIVKLSCGIVISFGLWYISLVAARKY
jgi:hypothetical protein